MTTTIGDGAPAPVPEPEVPPATADDLRRAFRLHPAGVAIVTADASGHPVGLTVTSLTSVSTRPPLLSFNISRTSSSWPAMSSTPHVAVHLLSQHQADLATRFARSGIDRFAPPTSWAPGPGRLPILAGCAAWLVAAVHQRVDAGDHTIVIARVLRLSQDHPRAEPLIHHDGRFRRATDPRPCAAAGRPNPARPPARRRASGAVPGAPPAAAPTE